MNETGEIDDRIERLETRVTYQDDMIEQLNQTVTAQWKKIDTLSREIARLRERLEEAETNAPGPANEPPPHY